MSLATCKLDTLLMSPNCEIQFCEDCGLVHLSMGPLTLRLSQSHYTEIARDLNRGLIQLQAKNLKTRSADETNIRTLHS
jgi:hypothetical protein